MRKRITPLDAARIAACRELFVKYNGRSHKKIEAEMRELGFSDFSRRILYKRKSGRGRRLGWIAEFGWDAPFAGNAAALGCNGACVPGNTPHHKDGEKAEGEQDAHPPVDDFLDFQSWLKRVSPTMTWDWRHQLYLYEYLQRVTDGSCKRLMINMPPRHGKSELVTVRYAAWRMRRKPETKVILASYGQDLANTFSRGIKRVICDDLALESGGDEEKSSGGEEEKSIEQQQSRICDIHCKQCRKGTDNTSSSSSQHSVSTSKNMFPFASQRPVNTAAQWATAAGGGVRAVGVGGGVTGFGADLIVIDDPVKNRAQAESETFRDRVWDWYTDDLYTRLEPEGAIVLIQTRWHEDDLAGRLLKQMDEGGDQWEIVNLPAIAGEEFGELGELGELRELGEPGKVAAASESTTPIESRSSTSTEVERADEPVFKPKVIGFPRLYSHLPPDETTEAAQGEQDAHPPVDEAQVATGAAQGEQDAHPPVDEVQVATGAAGIPACEAGSSGLTAGGATNSHDARTIDPRHRHAGVTAVAGECASDEQTGAKDAHPPVAIDSPPLRADPIGRRSGDALCPERYGVEKLKEIRSQLGTYGFSALYQQRPTPAEGAIFKREWFRNVVDSAPPGLQWFRGYDLAISTRTTADYTASFRVTMDELGFLYIADGFRARIEYPEQRRYIIERIRTERNTQHGIEDSGHGKALVHELRRQMRLMQHAFRLVPVSTDKVTRALTWSPIAEEGKVKLVRGRWIDDFLDELASFPSAAHDDQPDAVSIAVGMMAEPRDRRLYRF